MATLRIELAPSAVDHPFAEMMATLLRQNLDDHPEKVVVAARLTGTVMVVVTDLDTRVTMRFDRGVVTFHGEVLGLPDVLLRAPSELVTKMSLVELTHGPVRFPDPRGAVAKELAAAEKRGELVSRASLRATPLLLGVTEILSIH